MPTDAELAVSVRGHYPTQRLEEAIYATFRLWGLDPERWRLDHIDAIDHFHSGGKQATLELAHRVQAKSGIRVLDIGGGSGGPARVLAHDFGCQVSVVELNEGFCRVGHRFAWRFGLGHRVDFHHGSILDLPFRDATFTIAWSMQSATHIADRHRLYHEIARVVKPGGRLALQELMAGPGGPLLYPNLFAGDASMAFMGSEAEERALICESGFRELAWEDMSEPYSRVPNAHMLAELMYPNAAQEMRDNARRNLEERRCVVIQGVFERLP